MVNNKSIAMIIPKLTHDPVGPLVNAISGVTTNLSTIKQTTYNRKTFKNPSTKSNVVVVANHSLGTVNQNIAIDKG